MSTQKKDWLSAPEVAKLFDVTPRTIGRWIDEGYLPGYRLLGGRRRARISLDNLRRFLEERPAYKFILEKLNNGQRTESRSDNSSEGREADQGAQSDERGTGFADRAGAAERGADKPSIFTGKVPFPAATPEQWRAFGESEDVACPVGQWDKRR